MTIDYEKQNLLFDVLEPLAAIRKVSIPTSLPSLHEIVTDDNFTARPSTPASLPHIPIDFSSRELPVPVPFQIQHSRAKPGSTIDASLRGAAKTRKRLPSGRPQSTKKNPTLTHEEPANQGSLSSSRKRAIVDTEKVSSRDSRPSKRVRVDPFVDPSRNENMHVKPFFSPAKLAAQAILSSENGELSATEIFAWMEANYAWIRFEPRQKNSWIYRVPAEMKRMSWIFVQIPGTVNTLWRIRGECRERMVVEAFKEGKLPPKDKLLGKPATS